MSNRSRDARNDGTAPSGVISFTRSRLGSVSASFARLPLTNTKGAPGCLSLTCGLRFTGEMSPVPESIRLLRLVMALAVQTVRAPARPGGRRDRSCRSWVGRYVGASRRGLPVRNRRKAELPAGGESAPRDAAAGRRARRC